MGLIDRLLRGRRTPESRDTRPLTAEESLARWRYLLGAAPPEALSEAHGRALETLEELPRAEVLQRLRPLSPRSSPARSFRPTRRC